MDFINLNGEDIVLIGEAEDSGKAWIFTLHFYDGEGGGYNLYVTEYHLINSQWTFVKRDYADKENNPAGYFEDMSDVSDYINNTPSGIYEGVRGFKHITRIGSLDELGVVSPRQDPSYYNDMGFS